MDTSLIQILSESGYIPVVSPIASGPSWESLNVNADHAAGELAGALPAEKLIILTDVEGIYRETEEGRRNLSPASRRRRSASWWRRGRSTGDDPQVEACLKALSKGVNRTHIINGRREHALILEIFTDAGIGTMVTLQAS